MSVTVTHEFKVCECCYVKIGTDEGCDCPPESHPDGLAVFEGLSPYVNVVPGDEDFGFCDWSRCDGCGSTLAGTRVAAAGLTDTGWEPESVFDDPDREHDGLTA